MPCCPLTPSLCGIRTQVAQDGPIYDGKTPSAVSCCPDALRPWYPDAATEAVSMSLEPPRACLHGVQCTPGPVMSVCAGWLHLPHLGCCSCTFCRVSGVPKCCGVVFQNLDGSAPVIPFTAEERKEVLSPLERCMGTDEMRSDGGALGRHADGRACLPPFGELHPPLSPAAGCTCTPLCRRGIKRVLYTHASAFQRLPPQPLGITRMEAQM